MNPAQIIARKRDGHALTPEEIGSFVGRFARDEIPDYQMAALAMAIYLRGMDAAETAVLTREMLASGSTLSWTSTGPPKVDKHSTGGVGDKVSLVLAPLLAACDLQVPMISGRGLGPTGGTLDKLESIPGFRTDLGADEIRTITERVGCVITGATTDLAPADRKLYALRDVTGTVSSIPLITASILSKKLAEGLQALVMDVKFGSGAFMKTGADAGRLARSLVDVATQMDVPTTALLTDMNQPLGRLVGNGVEVDESVEALSGSGPDDLVELSLALGAELLVAVARFANAEEAMDHLRGVLASGRPREKFEEMVSAQGGDLSAPRPRAPESEVKAAVGGFVRTIDSEQLGRAVIELGGGRKQKGDPIDHTVGLEMSVKRGDAVQAGEPLVRLFARSEAAERVRDQVAAAIELGEEAPHPPPLVAERVAAAG